MAKSNENKQRQADRDSATEIQNSSKSHTLRNADPLSGESGAHPVSTGVGAALGGAGVGALAGLAAGSVGAVAGAIAGGIAGAYAGKAMGEEVNPTVETEYWRGVYRDRPYYRDSYDFEDYERAYSLGWHPSLLDENLSWEEYETRARQKWEAVETWENEGGAAPMTWEEARLAVRDSFDRIRNRHSTNLSDGATYDQPIRRSK